jgi:two-component system chemotaxis response regulator CheB
VTCLPILRVLVVDDSAFMRKIIRDMLESDPEICVVGTAFDGLDALKKVSVLLPDVITLDVEMPRLDGLGCLEQLMRTSPRPVVMLSSLTGHGSKATIEALMKGATDFLEKPSTHRISDLEAIRQELIAKVKNAGRARIAPPKTFNVYRETPVDKTLSKVPMRCLVAIGASTGGPRALETVLRGLPSDLPAGIVITQHMPAGFTKSLADRLDRVCEMTVREAAEGCRITSGVAYIAAGGYHMKITDNQTIELDASPPIAYVKPSVDFMMCSLAPVFKERVIARLGIASLDGPAPLDDGRLKATRVVLPFKQHIGAPSIPVVKNGDVVKEGDLVADIPQELVVQRGLRQILRLILLGPLL